MRYYSYKGALIAPAPINGSGMRWVALGPLGQLRADTLAGIKDLIREQLAPPTTPRSWAHQPSA